MLGLNGAPQAGDKFNVFDTDKEAREIATKREQLIREQKLRTKKHVTLDEIGRRLALGSFKELNIILKLSLTLLLGTQFPEFVIQNISLQELIRLKYY